MLALCLESSHARGMGHLFRGLNLAHALRLRGLQCLILVNDHPPACRLIAERGFPYLKVCLDAFHDWEAEVIRDHSVKLWINDRLNTTQAHAIRIKSLGLPLVTLDDRGDGARYADLNVAALVFENHEELKGARVLSGSNYLILDQEINFYQRIRPGPVHSLLVSLGGCDTHGVTVKVAQFLAPLQIPTTIVLGPGFQHSRELDAVITSSFEIKHALPSLIAEFPRHDLVITGGGITPFEAAASGLPSIVIACEDFEVPVCRALVALGTSAYAGHYEAIDGDIFSESLPIHAMSQAGLKQVGLGGVDRVVDAISATVSGL